MRGRVEEITFQRESVSWLKTLSGEGFEVCTRKPRD